VFPFFYAYALQQPMKLDKMNCKQRVCRHLEKLGRNITLVERKKEMAQVDIIRNGIIDKLLAISDKDYLMALLRMVDNSSIEGDKIKLTKEQKLMFEMSEADIQNVRILSQDELDKNDLEWLKGKAIS
jgi:hypothetical protein